MGFNNNGKSQDTTSERGGTMSYCSGSVNSGRRLRGDRVLKETFLRTTFPVRGVRLDRFTARHFEQYVMTVEYQDKTKQKKLDGVVLSYYSIQYRGL